MIFIDTGAFLARHLAADQHHRKAVEAWDRLAADRESCFTSNFVLDETITLLARWAGYPFAIERARIIYHAPALTILRPGAEDETEALDLFEKYGDQEPSFTDCVSFILMRKRGIRKAFAFDRHFRTAGFRTWP